MSNDEKGLAGNACKDSGVYAELGLTHKPAVKGR